MGSYVFGSTFWCELPAAMQVSIVKVNPKYLWNPMVNEYKIVNVDIMLYVCVHVMYVQTDVVADYAHPVNQRWFN